jgi:hypothetical protein
MVKVPQLPFKIIDVGENHPFVTEALRPRKHYEQCWCGSGRKYRKCHQIRAQEERISLGQLLDEQRRIFWRKRGCMHPHASASTCQGTVIDSHTIQRKGPLEKIISANNHVMHLELYPSEGTFQVNEIGWRKASTFPGYCTKHDTQIFAQLERTAFCGSHEQCVLQGYRDTCNELYKKRALIEALDFQRNLVDRGCDIDEQINWQLSVNQNIAGQTKSMQEIEEQWRMFEDAVTGNKYDRFSSKCYFFEGDLCIASSGTLHVEYDFIGTRYSDMWDLSKSAELLSHSIMATESGGAIVFTWLTDQRDPQAIVSSFDDVSDDDKADVFAQYCFLNTENVYFSEKWWSALDSSLQEQVKKYAAALHYEGGPFVRNRNPLLNWRFRHLHGHTTSVTTTRRS